MRCRRQKPRARESRSMRKTARRMQMSSANGRRMSNMSRMQLATMMKHARGGMSSQARSVRRAQMARLWSSSRV